MLAESTTEKLTQLRKLMTEHCLDAYYVPSEDAHQSEYIAEWDGRRAFISGFTGSAGFAIITHAEAALWTDGRYFLQAEQQLDPNWTLMKAGLPTTPKKEEWLLRVLKGGQRVGVDSRNVSHDAAAKLREALEKSKISLHLMNCNLVDQIWTNRPKIDLKPVFHLGRQFSGREAADKISWLRKFLEEGKYGGFVVTALDEVAWLFNLRGSDIPCNPVFFAYAFVSPTAVILYTDDSRVAKEAKQEMPASVTIRSYDSIFSDLKELGREIAKSSQKLLITPTCNAALVESLGNTELLSIRASPIEMEKAVKNEVELAGMKACHIRDAVAHIRYFAWLESELMAGRCLTEIEASDKLEHLRSQGQHYQGLSFHTASAAGSNAAIIHYKAEPQSAAKITKEQIYLVDSGGQYLDGTTDITRTIHFGTPSREEKQCFTRVLQGNLDLERAVFPVGTTGYQLDLLARLPLWKAGLDYRHGTGHGVGHFLNVHEGPHSISFRPQSTENGLRPGMLVTNEPGYYEDGKFGIRIENILIVKPVKTDHNFGGVNFLGFENITLVPIDGNLIELSMLSKADREYLNEFHQKVWLTISPLLSDDQLALDWLRRATNPMHLS